jgi:hypothetical protein
MAEADVSRLRELCDRLLEHAALHPATARGFGDVVAGLLRLPIAETQPVKRRGARRAEPALDPFQIYRDDPAGLVRRLEALDLEQLRDVVAHYGMDPRRLAMKWKSPERVVEHIVETVELRARKGDVFRANPVEESPAVASGGTPSRDIDEKRGDP